MNKSSTLGLCLIMMTTFSASALAENVSLKTETRLAMKRGLEFLASQQNEAGYWSTSDHPGLSGLVIKSFATSPIDASTGRENPAVEKGAQYLLSRVQDDGGIYTTGQGLANYNTAISMMALHAIGDYEPIVRRARAFVVRGQQLGYEPGTDSYQYYGGVGYGDSHTHSDMINTTYALQSLVETRDLLNDSQDDPKLDWEAALTFLSRCQNLDEPVTSSNRGGFVYAPSDSKAGSMTLENGETALRSYGTVSYTGLMSYTYADLSKNDPRVQGVLDWLQLHYTLSENPGMDQQGLYYYYMTMAIGLDAAKVDTLTIANRGEINWREELVVHLLEIQEPDGSWQNKNGRWMERDPNLVTAYVLLALNKIYPDL